MVSGHHDLPTTADRDVSAWKSEIVGFIEDAKQELRSIVNALQSGKPLEPAPPRKREPEAILNVEPTPPNRERTSKPVETTAQGPADHEDRLEQLKRRIEAQLRNTEQK